MLKDEVLNNNFIFIYFSFSSLEKDAFYKLPLLGGITSPNLCLRSCLKFTRKGWTEGSRVKGLGSFNNTVDPTSVRHLYSRGSKTPKLPLT